MAQGLCPLEPTPDALAPALRALARRTQQSSGVACGFHATGDVQVTDPALAQNLYRIAQEALSNAVRHSRASLISIDLDGGGGSLSVSVEDDGVGLPPVIPPGGMGLRTMSFRAQIVDGQLVVEPASGGGTRVSCRVPRQAGAPAGRPRRAASEGRET